MSNKIIEGENPAEELLLRFQQPTESEPKKATPKKKATRSKAPKKKEPETRTRRVQLVLPPSLYQQLNDAAWNSRQSVNETIIQAITEYLKRSK